MQQHRSTSPSSAYTCAASRTPGRELLLRSIEHFYHRRDSRESISLLLSTLRSHTKFECVGLRLKSGEDYPYFETEGFPERFVEAERYLCAMHEGRPVRDEAGGAILECMCGNVISGRTDPDLPFFTPYGSFWSNSTTDLLAATTPEQRQGRTRNRCNHAGYESVALIPLYAHTRRVGLLQFNDSRRNMFTPELMDTLEHLSFIVGMYLGSIVLEDESRSHTHERAILLKEVHHRVKNNMQVITSLIHMQSRQCRDHADTHVFRSCEKRIHGLAAIEDQLYQAPDSGAIMPEYFIARLGRALMGIHHVSAERIEMRVSTDVSSAHMPVTAAIPLAMILNELFSNAFRHAFADDARGGLVLVNLSDRLGQMELVFRDTGVGMPEGFDLSRVQTFGLQVVGILVRQLRGVFEVKSTPGGGTMYRLCFLC